MTSRPWLSIILAAGLGTRMKSALPKAAHAVAGRPMVAHVAAAAAGAGETRLVFVVAPDTDMVREAAGAYAQGAEFVIQRERLGTANAVLAARAAIEAFDGNVLVLFGDTPLIRPETLRGLGEALDGGAAVAVLGFETDDPAGYGRLICDADGMLMAIREEKDASDPEKAIRLCNSGVMAFRSATMLGILERIGNANANGEYYLPDAVEIARSLGHAVVLAHCEEDEVRGVNDRIQLAAVEAIMQRRLREAAMSAGATLIAPETVTLCHDTRVGRDVIIEPNVVFGPGVTVADGVHIKAFCHIENAAIASGAVIGPFARLRPGAEIGEGAHIGNFVEIKKASVEAGAKVNHLAYVGDGRVGAKANVGAGTIFCNYDGFNKHFTDIGPGAFIGSNSALVAPVRIGAGAFVGSGSVITRDVEPDALALERSQQTQIPGWAAANRAKHGK